MLVPKAAGTRAHAITLAAVFLIVNLLLNSRAGRAIEQAMLHTLRTTFARFTWEILVTTLRGIMQIFQSLLEAIDRVLYAVDELLRFRAGQKKSTIVVKAILGVIWFFIAYFTRFMINLLVEPQINPIKHFPVVTVSHKMILPTTPYIAERMQQVKFAGVGIEASRAGRPPASSRSAPPAFSASSPGNSAKTGSSTKPTAPGISGPSASEATAKPSPLFSAPAFIPAPFPRFFIACARPNFAQQCRWERTTNICRPPIMSKSRSRRFSTANSSLCSTAIRCFSIADRAGGDSSGGDANSC